MTKKLEIELYRLTDSFLTEAKDQNGNGRSLEQLNQDRHLFVENCLTLIQTEREQAVKEVIGEIEKGLPVDDIYDKSDWHTGRQCLLSDIKEFINKLKDKYN